jgi:hypothetical protein
VTSRDDLFLASSWGAALGIREFSGKGKRSLWLG